MAEEQNIGEQQTTEHDATDAASQSNEENQATSGKTYNQKEVDDMMARMRGSLEHKLLKPYEGLGDPEELRELKAQAEKKRQEDQLNRGEFEKTLSELASKKDSEIQKRDEIIKEYKVNSPLLESAAKHRAVAPEQVRSLLAKQVRLGENGEVEVLGDDGSVRYDDSGKPYGVDDLVRDFIDANPHFGSATPSTTNTKSNDGQANSKKLDISQLDFSNPEHRKLYAEYRKTAGLA